MAKKVKTKILTDLPQDNAELATDLESDGEQDDEHPQDDAEMTGNLKEPLPESLLNPIPESNDPAKSIAKPKEMPEWHVSVNCPTPLARNNTKVRAFDAAGAWDVFCAMNGITGTDHTKTITKVE